MKIKSSRANFNEDEKENLPLLHKDKQKNKKRSVRKFGKQIFPDANTRSKRNIPKINQTIHSGPQAFNFLPISNVQNPPERPYHPDIVQYLLNRNHPCISFPTGRKNQKYQMCRAELLKYLHHITWRFRLRRKTLYLAVQYMDAYILGKDIRKQMEWAIIAQSCMLIAMKYEEIYPPRLGKWSEQEEEVIINAEAKILQFMSFNLAVTTAEHYLQLYNYAHQISKKEQLKLETALDLFLFTGQIYSQHPAALALGITQSCNTKKSNLGAKIENMITQNQKIWDYLIKINFHSAQND